MNNSSALKFQEYRSSSSAKVQNDPKCYIKGSNIFPSLLHLVLQTNVFSNFSSWPSLAEISFPCVEFVYVHPARFKNLTLHLKTSRRSGPSSATVNFTKILQRCACTEMRAGDAGGLHDIALSSPVQQRARYTWGKGLLSSHVLSFVLIHAFSHYV